MSCMQVYVPAGSKSKHFIARTYDMIKNAKNANKNKST